MLIVQNKPKPKRNCFTIFRLSNCFSWGRWKLYFLKHLALSISTLKNVLLAPNSTGIANFSNLFFNNIEIIVSNFIYFYAFYALMLFM